MSWKTKIYILSLVMTFTACKKMQEVHVTENKTSYLIEANELKRIIDQPNVKLVDFRKKAFYEKEHIIGAVNIWRTDIEDGSYIYPGMKANKEQLETLIGKLGIATKDTLIIYDDNALCDASRLWWLLQNYEHTNVKLLHGGLTGWKSINGTITSETPKVKEAIFKLTNSPSMMYYVSKEDVLESIDGDVVILDTRTADEFSGKRHKKGAAKAGRIAKSVHIDWAEAVDYNGNKRLKSMSELESIYNKLNITKNDSIIVYCHSGVRSAHTSFVLTQLLDYKNVRNYDGSWAEWSYFSDLPYEKDSLTIIKN